MIQHGVAPFLECSTKGDRRFSAFFARVYVEGKGVRCIEEHYQAFKVFADGKTGLHWKDAKGRQAINQEEARQFYAWLWDEYIRHNPELLEVLKRQSGLQDFYGQKGRCCQATELWRIKNDAEPL